MMASSLYSGLSFSSFALNILGTVPLEIPTRNQRLKGLVKERYGRAVKSLKKDNSARTYLHILSRKFVGISTLHTSKSAANTRYQGLEFTAVPLTGIAL